MGKSVEAGEALHLDSADTLADGLAAMKLLLERTKLLVEPAGSAGLAALLEGRVPTPGEAPAAIVLSGGNMSLEPVGRLLA